MKTTRLLLALTFGLGLVLASLWFIAAPLRAALAVPPVPCTVDDSGGADYLTIQDAVNDIACATINVAAGAYEENVVIARSLTLVGIGSGGTWVGGAGQVFLIDSTSAIVAISGVTIEGVYHSGDGTGVYNKGKLTLDDVLITDNEAGNNGGGIYNTGSLTLTNSVVEGGWAGDGGGIYNSYGDTLIIVDSVIQNSTAWGEGGGIFTYGALVIENSQVVSNTATGAGGGICGDEYNSTYQATITITNSEISGNTADAGGGIYADGAGQLILTDSRMTGNSSGSDGGGIYRSSGSDSLLLTDVTISNNQAITNGGGIYSGSPLVMAGGSVDGNTAENGGGIYSDRTLLLSDGTVSANTAGSDGGGIYASSAATLTNASVSDNQAGSDGGGIYSDAPLVLENSRVHGNTIRYSTGSGGGIYTSDDLKITASTVSSNTAASNGGGIWAYAAVTLTNVTLSGNRTGGSGGGMYATGYSTSTLDSVTISDNTADSDGDNAGNGGGLNGPASGVMIVKNTLIAGNYDDSPTDVNPDCFTYGSFTSQGYNLIGDNSGCTGFVLVTDQVGTSGSPLDPHLTALDDYGGPTPVHALRYGRVIKSPAVDTGAPDCPAADQRGVLRPIDGDEDGTAACDTGAFELAPDGLTDMTLVKTVVPSAAAPGDAVTYTLTFENAGALVATGVCITDTLPSAVTPTSVGSSVAITQVVGTQFVWQVEDLEPGAEGVITLSGVLSSALAGGVLTNTATIAADMDDDPGNNSSSVSLTVVTCFATPDDGATVYQSIDAQAMRDAISDASAGDVVKVAGTCAGVDGSGRVVSLDKDITLRGGYTAADWTAADPDNPATLDAQGGGRVVYAINSDIVLGNLRITGGNTTGGGGGVYVSSGSALIHRTSILSNTAETYGGGVYAYSATLTLERASIAYNTVEYYGGGVAVMYGSVVLSETVLLSNTVEYYGGGVYADSADVQMDGGQLRHNVSGVRGGGLYVNTGHATLKAVDISDNATADSGGGVCIVSGSASLNNAHVFSNTAGNYGGGVYVIEDESSLNVSSGQVYGNTAGQNGGGVLLNGGNAAFTQTHIFSNMARSYGGGIFVYSATVTVSGAFILSNTAKYGGGVFINSSTATLNETRLSNNTADHSGGGVGVYVASAELIVNGGEIISNTADTYGGGVAVTSGNVTVSKTNVLSNTAGNAGGGMYVKSGAAALERSAVSGNAARYGGGIYNDTGALALTNVTLGQNAATYNGGGLFANDAATVALTFTTIADNQATSGGGLYHTTPATVSLQNSLLAGNSPHNCDTAITSNGYNLDDGDTCGFTATGDQPETDPLLGSLADNGGDTLTYALQLGSPAIDAGLCVAGVTTDQRGDTRPYSGSAACDVGAYESDTTAFPDVAIVKTVSSSSAAPGDDITYTLAFSNAGSSTATNVVITDAVPVGQIGDLSYASSGVTLTLLPGAPFVWRVANLTACVRGVITLTGALRSPLAAGTFTNTATISARRDSDSGNNSSAAQVTVPNLAPVALNANLAPVNEEASLNAPFIASDANGDALTYGFLTMPVSGSVALAGADRFVYTPTNRTTGYTDTFTYVVSDTAGLTGTATITIPVTANDDPPTLSNIGNRRTDPGVAVGPIAFTIDDVDTPIPVLTLDKGSSNLTLVPLANIVFGGSGKNRTVTITPTMNSGMAVITITVSDGNSASYDTLVLAVGAVNSPPEFTSTPIITATEDAAYTYNVLAADPDVSNTLTITAVTKPGWLALIDHHNRTATLGGTPNNAAVGDHAVALQVMDSAGVTATQSFTVTVANVNDAPVARDDTANTNENTPMSVAVLPNDSDPDGDSLFLAAVGAPLYGNTVISGSVVVYIPTNRPATYTDPFTYTISDGVLTSSAQVTVTVSAINDPPTISNIPDQTTAQGVAVGPIAFTVGDPDTSADALTLGRASSNPALVPVGAITFGGSGASRTVTVTPVLSLSGSAIITVTVGDGNTSRSDAFLLQVTADNPPVFTSTPITAAMEDIAYTYNVLATDADPDDVLTLAALTRPAWLTFTDHGDGTATLTGLPTNANVGSHTVVLRVIDRVGALNTQSFTITVAAVNDPPLARDDFASTDEDTPRSIAVLVNDQDPDSAALSIVAVTAPLYGSASINSDTVIYTPANRPATYTDTFAYTVSDGALTDIGAISVTVLANADPPMISNILNHSTGAGVPVGPIPFTVNDPDTPPGSLALGKVSSNPALAPVSAIIFGGSGVSRTVTITPTAGSGTAVISITVSDGGFTATDAFVLAVAVNSPPEFTSAPITAAIQNKFYVYHVTTADVDASDALTITAITKPAWLTLYDQHNGEATLVGKPLLADSGIHNVTLRVADNAGGAATQSFTITVSSLPNRPPVARAGVDQNVVVNTLVTLHGGGSSDPDNQLLTYGWRQTGGTAVTLSSATISQPTFTAPGSATVLTFTLVVTDSLGLGSAPDTVVVTVSGVPNQAPVANAGSDQAVTINTLVALNGSGSSDPDGNLPLVYSWTQTGGSPPVVLNSATISQPTFTAPGSATVLTFTLVVTDSLGLGSAPDTVVVTVSGVPNQPPIADAGPNQAVNTRMPVTLNGSNSFDPDGHPLTYGWKQAGGLLVSLSSDSAISPTFIAPGSTTILTFTLIVTDSLGLASVPDTVVIAVTEYRIYLPLVTRN